ncbi:hypothetical protein E2C01_013000 [Portunus trituberculatus]|uniref:Uncharacterized protein n=1 Tax=Portunus trituberculatus TaxID=210409 RepID=A0A5B7DFB7_PORTR|nr:hypothetical protein [Portunus trituberculatus]
MRQKKNHDTSIYGLVRFLSEATPHHTIPYHTTPHHTTPGKAIRYATHHSPHTTRKARRGVPFSSPPPPASPALPVEL